MPVSCCSADWLQCVGANESRKNRTGCRSDRSALKHQTLGSMGCWAVGPVSQSALSPVCLPLVHRCWGLRSTPSRLQGRRIRILKLVVPQTWQHRGLRSHQQPLEPSLQDCPQPHATLHALHAPPSPVARLVKGATGAASQATCRPVTTSPGPHEYVSCSRRAHGRAAVTACCNVRALQGRHGARVTSPAS